MKTKMVKKSVSLPQDAVQHLEKEAKKKGPPINISRVLSEIIQKEMEKKVFSRVRLRRFWN